MNNKLGRNEPCWCGSCLKYKRCHLNRQNEEPATIQEVETTISKGFSKKYCMHQQASSQTCKGNIVYAHTIQRRGGLSRIARDGHVYTCLPRGTRLTRKTELTEARLIGIQQASTFTGFCSYHDTKIFEPIEKHSFQGNQQHTFLLGYRAIAREAFLKKSSLELIPFKRTLDRGKSVAEQVEWQDLLDAWHMGVSAGTNEIMHYKAAYDKALVASDFSDYQYYVIRINDTPDFLCSATIQPEYDFNGRRLQVTTPQNINSIFDHITFSIIGTDTGGAIVFGWLGPSKAGVKLVKSLDAMTNDLIPHAIVRFTYEFFENTYASPNWWEHLDDTAKQALIRRQMTEIHPNLPRSANCLRDDGLRLVSWTIVARETNIQL